MKAEIGYYRAHLWMGREQPGWPRCGAPCAEVLRDALDRPELDLDALTETLLAAIRFEPFPDTVPGAAARCGRRASGSSRRRTGTSRCTSSSSDRADGAARRRALLGRGRRAEAGPGDLHARSRSRARRRTRRCTSATTSRPTSAARSRRAGRRC